MPDDDTIQPLGNSPERRGRETHGAADVHGIVYHIERETLDACVHQDTKVIAKERPCNTQCVG